MEPTFRSAVPTFVVSEVAATARWYAENLGFRIAGHVPAVEPWAYASLMLGSAELMLLRAEGDAHPQVTPGRPWGPWNAYLRMDGVRAYYERLEGHAFVTGELRKQSYGDWEFEVRDPNGYILVFGGDVAIPKLSAGSA